MAVRPLGIAVLIPLLLLAACTAAKPEPAPSSTPGTLAPVGDLGPEEYAALPIPDDQVTAAVSKLDGMATEIFERSKIPGMAVAVVQHGKVVYEKGFGVRELGKPEPVTADTVFQVASVSKSLASTCVSRLVTEKRLAWSDPVVKYLPDFRLADPEITRRVTVADLFSHRSGLPGAAGDDLEGIGFDRAQVLSRLDQFPLNSFRTSYGYSNFGLTAGAEAAAAAAGKPWEQACAEELYAPLGMTSTSSRHDDFVARPDRATLHFQTAPQTFEPLYTRNADAQSPAGGVSSTVGDLASWMGMNLAGGVVGGKPFIDPAVLQESHTPQIVNGPAQTPIGRSRAYGYGFNVETTSTGQVKLGHSGAFYVGAGTAFAMLPAADVGIVVLTNASPVGAAEAITTGFIDLVRTGTVERDWLDYFGPIFGALFVNHSPVAQPAPKNARDVEAVKGPLVVLPHRRYLLYSTTIDGLDDWDELFKTPFNSAPNFVWPTDHRWCVASDVDPHWAGIGADVDVIDQLVASSDLDVVRADPADDQPTYY